MTDFSHVAGVLGRLAEIEHDLEERQIDYENAARQKFLLTRDWDKRLAIARGRANGSDAEARKAAALVMAAAQDDLYDRLQAAEAEYEALKVVTKTLETRASIGQSILRAQGRT